MAGSALWAGFWGFIGGISLLLGAGLGLTIGVGQKVTATADSMLVGSFTEGGAIVGVLSTQGFLIALALGKLR